MALDSTISARTPVSSAHRPKRESRALPACSKLLVNQNVEPAPGADSTWMFAAHHLHQLLADREAEPGAAVLAGGRAVGLREFIEDPRLRLAADADAGVA